MARLTPVTEAELERYGGEPEPTVDRTAALEDIRAEIADISAKVDELPDPGAERRAEMDQAGIDETVVHEPQAEPTLEASWQPGDAKSHREPVPEQDADTEMEIG